MIKKMFRNSVKLILCLRRAVIYITVVAVMSGLGSPLMGCTSKNENQINENITDKYLETFSETGAEVSMDDGPETGTDVITEAGSKAQTETQEELGSSETENAKNPKHMTTMEVTKDCGIGINLGNTFEACGSWINGNSVKDYETAWGSPVITKDMIAGFRKEGFKTIRIPVAWSNMMGADYTLNKELVARVKEVVSWAIESDMYVILNIHWDGGWWTNFPTDKYNCMNKYKAIWRQICSEFGMYSHKLIFESLNEEGCWDSLWNQYSGNDYGKATAYNLLNEINQTFVDIVRNSGYNNIDRHLLIAGYATDVKLTCDEAFVMPKDSADRCAVSVHYYTPSSYCVLKENASWSQAKTTWGAKEDIEELNKYFDMLKVRFIDKGVPVIVGEFGVIMDNKTKDDATKFLTAVAKAALTRNMCPVLWDTTSKYSFYNREKCAMTDYPKLKENFYNLMNK